MVAKFVKLTELKDLGEIRNTIYINIDNISSISKALNDKTTFVTMNNGDKHLVEESVVDIMSSIGNSGSRYITVYSRPESKVLR